MLINRQLPIELMPQTPRTYSTPWPMPTLRSSVACGRVPPPSTDLKSSPVSRERWRSVCQLLRSSRHCKRVAPYEKCAHSSAVSPNGCEWGFLPPARTLLPGVLAYPLSVRDYYAALLRTHQSFVAPTQGKLLNYVQRVPLGVVAQITVCPPAPSNGFRTMYAYTT
jgi:hypothetical protein